jgi:hypothetical protein
MLIAVLGVVTVAQPLNNPFPWVLDPTRPIDNSIIPGNLSAATAQKGRISIRNGKLVYPDGSRARLYGVTIAGPAVFPDSAQAIAVAKRLQSLGINLVRLTYFDYTYYNDASILIRSNTTSRGFDSTMLRRFDWFIAQLRNHGIYVSLVLRSARHARRDDGIAGWDSVRNAGRMYSYFLPGYQMVVRDFIYDLLSRRNQFTGIPYRDDPTIAILELEQDNSLFTQWINNNTFSLAQGGQLSYFHSRMLDSAFIRFVLAKYRTAQAAQAAWRFSPRSTSNVIGNPSFGDPFDNTWLLNLSNNALAVTERDPLDKKEGSYSMRIRISQPGSRPQDIRFRNLSPQLQRYALYRVQLWARTDAARRLVTFSIANFSFRDTLTSQWREYTYTFRSNNEGTAQFNVDVGGTSGDVWLDNVRVTAIEEPGLLPGESFSSYTVARSRYNEHTTHSLARWRDNLEFYQTLTENWFTWMQRLIHDTLRCTALIAPGNQQAVLNDIYAARLLDLPSVGTGWDSPYRRIAGASSDSAWYILNDPQLGHPYGGLIYVPSRTRIAGKPLMVNSYSIPYPHASMSEMTTLLPAYLAYQDADVYVLTYYAYNRSSLVTPWVRDRYGPNAAGTITHYELAGNPAVMALVPLSSYVFCNELISPANEELLLQQTSEALAYPPYNQFGAFFLYSGADARIPLFRRVAIDSFNASLQSYQPHREIPALADLSSVNTAALLSDTGELLWNANDTLLLIRTPRYRAATGVLRGKILDISGNASHTVERLDDGWIGTVQFLSLDGQSLDSTQQALLSLVTRSCATGAIWSGDSSTYRNWGAEPMQLEAMNVTINWRHAADSLTLIPLDSSGKPLASRVRPITKASNGRFRFTLDQRSDRTVWYAARFTYASSPASITDRSTEPIMRATVHQNRLTIELSGAGEGTQFDTRLFSLDGRCLASWINQHAQAPVDIHSFDLPPCAPGVYLLQATVGTHMLCQKIILAP